MSVPSNATVRWQRVIDQLGECNCCERHQKNKPTTFERWSETPTTGNWDNDCLCNCRSLARNVCREFDELVIAEDKYLDCQGCVLPDNSRETVLAVEAKLNVKIYLPDGPVATNGDMCVVCALPDLTRRFQGTNVLGRCARTRDRWKYLPLLAPTDGGVCRFCNSRVCDKHIDFATGACVECDLYL